MTESKFPVLDKIVKNAMDHGLGFYFGKIEEAKAKGEIINHNTLYVRGQSETLKEFWNEYISNYREIQGEINKFIVENRN